MLRKLSTKKFRQDGEISIYWVFTVSSFLGLIWEDSFNVLGQRIPKNKFKPSFVHGGHCLMSKGHAQVSSRGEITMNREIAN